MGKEREMKILSIIMILAAAYNAICFAKAKEEYKDFKIVYLVNAIVLFLCAVFIGIVGVQG
jgi:hypothetical protein